MTAIAMHSAPRWAAVATEQVRAVALLMRRAGLLLLSLYLVGIAVGIKMALHVVDMRANNLPGAHINLTYSPPSVILVTLVALLLPFGVWEDEDPRRRAYHWSMPVTRSAHAVARVIAGWVWLMAATLLYLIGAALTVVITERITGEAQSYGPQFVAWTWLYPFTAATIAYLLLSVAAVGSRKPIAWVLVVIALFGVLSMILRALEYQQAAKMVEGLYTGEYGLAAAVMGHIQGVNAPRPGFYWSLTRWLGSTAIWASVATGLLLWVARRRPE
jgi:hypothetical protein